MKKTIVKYKHAIIALIMIVLNSVGASASTPWTVNPSDYRYDMSLYLDVKFAASEMDYSLYDVGVFCGDECRGVAEVLSLSNGNNCLYVRARSNQESGETMTFKYYDKETEKISDIDGVSFTFESNGRLGYPSDPYIVKIIRHFDVILSAGNGGIINHTGGRIAESTEITLTATPNEGYHFEKWSNESTENPMTIVVNEDITLSAEFGVNTYKLTYTVDGVEYKSFDFDYGTALTAEANPEKEGHIFSGWEGLPETMPAHDVTVSGTFSINSYDAVFKIGEEVIETKSVVFGQPVVAPDAPTKEGHTFAGWQNVPETMPAHDVEILGGYTVNQYELTYTVDGATYKEYTIDYGTALTAEANPEKEGHTFSGWEGLPETMPAYDVTVSGTFSINSYDAVFKIGEEVIETKSVVFGQPVVAPDAPTKEGHTFAGWQNVPETMPAHDVEILGSYTVNRYKLTYVVDEQIYKAVNVAYGTTIVPEAPEKEGYAFSGWEGLPETMPAHDVTATGSFIINAYKITFKIDEEVIETKSIVFGQPIVAPEAPAKEGYTFAGWQNVPETMPAHDVEILGSYTVNQYKLTYIVDGAEYKSFDVDYGTPIIAETNPEKEGHTFSGWEGLTETMPAHDVTVTGTFSINSYDAVFKIGEDVIETKAVVFGQPIVAPEAPAKEGYTFAGWQNVPETMPAHDVEIVGSYDVNNYVLTYIVDDETYKEITVAYGSVIVPEEPEKEGHTFSGWEGLPETMPAYGVTVKGYFTVNKYILTLYLNNEVYSSEEIEFGTTLNIEEPVVPEGKKFDGWTTAIPKTMPAYDLDIYGTYSDFSSIASIYIDNNANVTVYSVSGVLIYKDKNWSEIADRLENGLYIINGQKVIIRK